MGAPDQLTRDQLRGMTPKQIEDARQAGQLDTLLTPPPTVEAAELPRVKQYSRAEVAAMSPAQVEAARRAGHLAELLGGTAPVDVDAI